MHWREVLPTDWTLSVRTSGRYHRGLDHFPPEQSFPALYTSLAPEIAIWEMVRRSAARNLAVLQNNVLSELDVTLDSVLDLSDPTSIGLTLSDLTSADQQVCQDLAAAVVARGDEGLLVPSAGLPGLNLVILPQNLVATSFIGVVRSTKLPLDTIAAEEGDAGKQANGKE